VTRREWLTQHPPPKSAANIKALLEQLNLQNQKRAELVKSRADWDNYYQYQTRQKTAFTVNGQASDAAYCAGEMLKATVQIAEADRQLNESNGVPGQIAELQVELGKAGICPIHQVYLQRWMNRAEDMFICSTGPHYLHWTDVKGKPALVLLEKLVLPDLDAEL
jgi:hypothetical protein